MNYLHRTVQINDVDGEPHAQSMNSMAGNNPEASTVTEVTRGESKQATQPAPMRVSDGESRRQEYLSGLIKSLPLRR